MYGNHDYETAMKIAKEKGEGHIVLPCGDEAPGLFTIGVPIKALSGADFVAKLKKKITE